MVEIVFDDEGRLVRPKGLHLRLPSSFIAGQEPETTQESEERAERYRKFWEETDAALADVPRKPWPKDDPIIEKYRRMGILEED